MANHMTIDSIDKGKDREIERERAGGREVGGKVSLHDYVGNY